MKRSMPVRVRFRPLPWSDARPAIQASLVATAWFVAAIVICLFRFRFAAAAEGEGTGMDFLRQLAASIPCFAPWMLATPVLARTVVRLPLSGQRWWLHLVMRLAIGGPVIYGVVLAEAGLTALGGMRRPAPSPLALPLLGLLLQVVVYASAVGLLEMLARSSAARRREQELADLRARRLELENDLRDAELEALRMKLNPHFLFNALQNVTALMRVDACAAERMLSRLGDVLRMTLRLDLTSEVPLARELEVASAYLDLERLRFQDRLSVTIDVDRDLREALVPSLILQPLVENAIRHGVGRVAKQAALSIDARRADGDLVIRVRDNGVGFVSAPHDEMASGVGLGVLRSRLDRLYAGQAECRCRNGAGGGAVVELRLPYHTIEASTGVPA